MNRNLQYWERRKAQRMFEYMAKAEDAADEIAKLYQNASRYLSREMEKIYQRYRGKHHLSEAEAYRLLHMLRDQTSIEELKAALRAGGEDEKGVLAELESAAYQARLERLGQLQNQLDLTMQSIYQQEKAKNTSHYVDLANEAYYRSIFEIQQHAGLNFSFHLIAPEMVGQVINSKWSGANYSTRIWHNTQALAEDLKKELLMNLVTGRTDREVAELIANKFAQGASNARRLVRTESCNLANQIEMESYKECGIEKYRFVATLDLRTSPPCRALDGKVFPVLEQQPGKNCPPMHPWCRSTTIADFGNGVLARMKRRARDPVTGKANFVPGDMTYEQWHEKNVRGRPEAELNEKMVQNRPSDKRQYEKYKSILGNDAPNDLDSFQKMKYTDSEKWKGLNLNYKDTNRYNKLVAEAENLNIKGKLIKNIDRIDLTEFSFQDHHINSERLHQITKGQAQQYVNDSVAAYSRWGEQVTLYVSPSGAAIVDHKKKTVSTAYNSEEYDDKLNKLLEVLGIDKVPPDGK